MSPQKSFASNNGEIYTPIWFYSLILTWGHSDWNIRLCATNFCNKSYRTGTAKMESPYYSYTKESYNGYSARPTFSIEVTYTFGYGKKVSRGDDDIKVERAASAIM